MIFDKTQEIQGNFTTRQNISSQPIFTKILIIDKRNRQASFQVYSMSPETIIDRGDLQALKLHFISGFHDESFIPMGVLVSIDRKKKMIKLNDAGLVSYEHLIVATHHKRNSNDDVNDFFAGLAALVDALRIQEKSKTLSQHYYSQSKSQAIEKKHFHLSGEKDQISQSVYGGKTTASDWFFDTDIRLYEVQI